MSSKESTTDHGIETVEIFADGLARDYAILNQNNNSAAARLVWFVAIAGFALLNVGSLANSIIGTPLAQLHFVLLVFPWALAGLCGIVAHWLNGEVMARDNVYHILKQHAIRAWLANAPRQPSVQEVLSIINVDTTDDEVAKRKSAVDKISPAARWWENATFASLIFSFSWSVLFPLGIFIFNSCVNS